MTRTESKAEVSPSEVSPTEAESPAISGVLPVVQTIFDQASQIDPVAMRAELDWIVDQGADGLVTGMVSELLRLTEHERYELSEIVVAAARRRNCLSVISCGAESTVTALAHARHAAELGADAVMAAPPVTVALDDDAVFKYYATILESVGVPLVVQDASSYVGQPLSIQAQVSLLECYGDQVYFKPEAAPIGPRLSQLRDASDGRAKVFEGSGGAALIDSYRRGVVGTMPGSDVCWAIRKLWDSLRSSDWPKAYAISGTLNALGSLQTTVDSYVAVEKHLLARQGVIESQTVREPTASFLDCETQAEVDRLFDCLVEIVAS